MFQWLGFGVSCAVVLAACGPDGAAPGDGGESDLSARGAELEELETEIDPGALQEEEDEAAWIPCGGRFECREIEVPVDHDDPTSAKLTIALTRVPHWEGNTYRGAILINPGGPGAPGRPFLERVNGRRALGALRDFDLVTFDPRGVGDSGAVPCDDTSALDDVFAEGGTAALIGRFEVGGRNCAERMGALFDHLGSHAVVRDMDLIREALGQEQLNFIGASYGTRLGALYAETFPERVRAFVLDGPVHPVADLAELVSAQFEALLAAMGEFLADCDLGVLDCPPDAEAVVDVLWSHSVAIGNEGLFAGFWKNLLADPYEGREFLARFLHRYILVPEIWDDAGGGDPGGEDTLGIGVNQTVHCSDQSAALLSVTQIENAIANYTARGPRFAVTTLPLATCAGWHVRPDPVPRLTAQNAPPLLLLAGEHDILTPHEFATAMHDSLESSVLVTSGHYGHGALSSGSDCVDELVDRFFVSLELPEDGTACP